MKLFDKAIDRAGMVAKNYQSNVTLYKKKGIHSRGAPKLEKVKDYEIRVNQPLKFERFAVYQVDYKLNELNKMTFALENKETNEEFGNLTVDLFNPQTKYQLSKGYSVEMLSYFPDFEFDEEGNQRPNQKYRTILLLFLKCLLQINLKGK